MIARILPLLLTLAAAATARAETQTVYVAVVNDGPAQRQLLPADAVRRAVEETRTTDMIVQFSADKQFAGDWTLSGADNAIDRAMADPDVDIVLLVGTLVSHQAAHRAVLPKPAIAVSVVDPLLQGFPLQDGHSGRPRFSYIADFHGVGDDVRSFHNAVGFRHLAVLVDQALLDALQDISAKAAQLADELGVQISLVRTSDTADAALDALPADADAVYVTPLLRFSAATIRELAQGLQARRLPAFSMIGRSELEQGLLMTSGGAENDIERLARRIGIEIQRIAEGEDPALMDVAFPAGRRFAINMRVAAAIGFSPRWEFLADAEQLGAEPAEARGRLTLIEAMQEALAANPALQASAARLDSQGAEVRVARSALLPSLDIGAGSTRIDDDRASSLTQAENQTSLNITGRQIIYSERLRASYAISKNLYEAAGYGYRGDRLDLMQGTATAYLDVLRAKALESVRRDSVENTRTNLETARVREQVGLADHSDYLRWVAELARDREQLLAAESIRRQAETRLMRILHRPQDEPIETLDSGTDGPLAVVSNPRVQALVDTPAGWASFTEYAVQIALEQAPEIAQSNVVVDSRQRVVTAARRAYYVPDLAIVTSGSDVMSQYGAGSGSIPGAPDDRSWSISLQASWPLFSGGRRRAELSRARTDLRAAEADCLAAADVIEARTREALHRIAASWPSIELSRTAAAAADENLRMVTGAYEQGAVSITELISARDAALDVRLAAADAQYTFLIDFVDVLRAMGDFDALLDPLSRDAWYDQVDRWIHNPTQARAQTCQRG